MTALNSYIKQGINLREKKLVLTISSQSASLIRTRMPGRLKFIEDRKMQEQLRDKDNNFKETQSGFLCFF